MTCCARSNKAAETGASLTGPVSRKDRYVKLAAMTERRIWHVLRHRAAAGAAILGVAIGGVGCTGSSDNLHSNLDKAVLQLSDFPPTWRAYPQSGDTRDVLGEAANCTGDTTGGKVVTSVRSPEFRHADLHITSTGVATTARSPFPTAATPSAALRPTAA